MAVYQLTVHLTHTTSTHVPRSLYAHPKYNDTAYNIRTMHYILVEAVEPFKLYRTPVLVMVGMRG
jgi:hypothetical protein